MSVVSTGNCIWVTTADGCVHTADATQLDSFVASASAVCIGHNNSAQRSQPLWTRERGM